MRNKIIPYNPKLKGFARKLRKNSTFSEIVLWEQIKKRALGIQFYRQVPIDEYIVGFYCHECKLAIEVDGSSHDSEDAHLKDKDRQFRLESLGVRLLRFDGGEVANDMQNVLRTIETTIANLLK